MAPEPARGRVARVLHHPVTVSALKSGTAAGLAFLVGGLLPDPMGAYNYYAAMGAFSVVLPALSDSLQSAMRTVLAILLGIGVAVGLQALASTSWWVVGLAIALAVVVSALPVLRHEASWVPLVALFVLAFGGEDPRQFALGYLVQVPLGALIGLGVNFLLVAPLPMHPLETGLRDYRLALHQRVEQLVSAVEHGDGTEPAPDLLDQVETRREQLSEALALNQRARRGNPRRGRYARRHSDLHAQTYALQRCELLTSMAPLALADLGGTLTEALRRPLAATFDHLATGLATAPGEPGAETDRAWVHGVRDEVDALLSQVVDPSVPQAQRALVTTLAYAARDAADRLDEARRLPLQ